MVTYQYKDKERIAGSMYIKKTEDKPSPVSKIVPVRV